jgi:Tfp pilus assembly protein PilO
MPRNFDLRAQLKNRRVVVRLILGAMLFANLVAAAFVFHPLGGSPEDLARELEDRQRQLTQQRQRLERTRNLVGKVQQAKGEGDMFLEQSTMGRRTAFSTLIGEINKMAVDAGMKTKDSSWALGEVEGSETLVQLTISANFEGSYANLTKFVNLLDRSPRFLIIESLQAQPQPTGILGVNVRLDTFIRQEAHSKS